MFGAVTVVVGMIGLADDGMFDAVASTCRRCDVTKLSSADRPHRHLSGAAERIVVERSSAADDAVGAVVDDDDDVDAVDDSIGSQHATANLHRMTRLSDGFADDVAGVAVEGMSAVVAVRFAAALLGHPVGISAKFDSPPIGGSSSSCDCPYSRNRSNSCSNRATLRPATMQSSHVHPHRLSHSFLTALSSSSSLWPSYLQRLPE